MAKITITLEDDPATAGDVDIKIESDPPLPMKDGKYDLEQGTAAHDTLVVMMHAATEDAEINSVAFTGDPSTED